MRINNEATRFMREDHEIDSIIDHEFILREKSCLTDNRLNAMLHLLEKRDQDFIQILKEILGDENDEAQVRAAAALALGKLGLARREENNALEALLANSATQNAKVRKHIMEALGAIGDEKAVPALIDALEDEDNHVFASAAEGLGKVGRPAVPHLIDLLDSGRDDARCVAAWQLGEIADRKASTKLAEVVLSQGNEEVIALSIWALGEIGTSDDKIMEALIWGKRQASPDIRLRADMAMKKIVQYLN